MSQQAATITSLPMAFEMVKAMQAEGLEWGEGYRPLGRLAVAAIIEEQMVAAVDRHLAQLGIDDAPDRRNGHYSRHLLTTLGDIELRVPRTRRYSPTGVLRALAVLRLITNSNFVGCTTDRSAGFSPLRMRPV